MGGHGCSVPPGGVHGVSERRGCEDDKRSGTRTRHWAFQPLKSSTIPQVRNGSWPLGAIDSFVLRRLEEKGLTPAGPADKRSWLRRATYDLTGLPPAPSEIDAFLSDDSRESFARVVDRLLASPRYGEQWGRHWLDLARYADTSGDSADYPIPQAALYRDYVIASFNADKPYDQFLREQIAGDLLPSSSEAQRREQIIATGFIALSRRFSVHPENVMHLTIEDTIDTLGKTVLGLTVSCARCHDHKFDPISTEDYYGLYGIFSSSRYPFAGSENRPRPHLHVLLLSAQEEKEKFDPVRAELAAAEAIIDATNGNLARREEQNRAIRTRDRIHKTIGPIPFAYALAEGRPEDASVQIRGEPGRRGKTVPRHFLTILGGQTLPPGEKGSGRLELGQWLSDAKNPLTARVMVNRIWQYHFGQGLVKTPSDFGTRGQPHESASARLSRTGASSSAASPSRRCIARSCCRGPIECRASGTTATRNQTRTTTFSGTSGVAASPPKKCATRCSPPAAAWTLRATGPHPFPPESTWHFTQHAAFEATYETKHRSVYVMQQRIRKHPYFAIFDGADTNASTAERLGSTTPLQALFFMNDPFAFECADHLVKRLESIAPHELERVHLAYEWLLARPPAPEELAWSIGFVRQYEDELRRSTTQPAGQTPRSALSSLVRVLMSSNEFMFLD